MKQFDFERLQRAEEKRRRRRVRNIELVAAGGMTMRSRVDPYPRLERPPWRPARRRA